MFKSLSAFFVAALGVSGFSAAYANETNDITEPRAAASVSWDAAAAALGGSGCVKDVDSFVIANGNDLSVIFTNLGFSLAGGSGDPLAARKNCAFRVPATIAKGIYIGELTQIVTYGITKTAGSQGSVATRSTFFGFPVNPYTVSVPYGSAINQPLLTQTRKDRFFVNTAWWTSWCALQRNPKGLFQANFAVSGQRDSDFEDLIMFVDGLDLKYEVKAALQFCGVN